MVTIPTTAFLICLHLAAGSFILMPIPPIREFGLGFFRTMSTIAVLVMGAALYLMPLRLTAGSEFGGFTDAQGLSVAYGLGAASLFVLLFLLMLGYTIAIWLGRLAASAILMILCFLLSVAAIGVSVGPFTTALSDGWSQVLVPLNFYVSTIYQASGLVAMILGHQYLMPVKLPFRSFEIFAQIFLVSCLMQCGLVGFNIIREMTGAHAELLTSLFTLGHPLSLFFWIRIGVGLLAVALVAGMTVHCVKLQANMAATGLLYVGMSMAIGGEIFARILLMTTSILF